MSMSNNPQDFIKGSVRLSSLPEIYFKINDVINDPESSFGDVAEIISNDVSLSVRLLKIVNSSFYKFPSEIDTISHAISIVGTQQLRDLALATMVLTAFEGIPEDSRRYARLLAAQRRLRRFRVGHCHQLP